jgi:hypothetical protein
VGLRVRREYVDSNGTPGFDLVSGRPGIRHDSREVLRLHEGEKRAAVPLCPVEDSEHLLACVCHLLLDPHLIGIEIHQSPLEAEAASAEESLVDLCRAQDVGAQIANE